MYRFFKLVFAFLGVWLVAASLNGFLCGYCLLLAQQDMANPVCLSLLFSFAFSLPFVACVGLVTFVADCCGKNGFALFQITLATTLVCATIAALVFILIAGKSFGEARYAMGISIVVAALTGVMAFRKKIRNNE